MRDKIGKKKKRKKEGEKEGDRIRLENRIPKGVMEGEGWRLGHIRMAEGI